MNRSEQIESLLKAERGEGYREGFLAAIKHFDRAKSWSTTEPFDPEQFQHWMELENNKIEERLKSL